LSSTPITDILYPRNKKRPDNTSPEQRLTEHKSSLAAIGNHRTRLFEGTDNVTLKRMKVRYPRLRKLRSV
jgi:hypothetical protein